MCNDKVNKPNPEPKQVDFASMEEIDQDNEFIDKFLDNQSGDENNNGMTNNK